MKHVQSPEMLMTRVLAALAACILVATPALSQVTATVTGAVFEDANGNGQRDPAETGLGGVVLVAIEEDTGAPITTVTDPDGRYMIEADTINHRIRVDESSLPLRGQLTTSRQEYNLNVPPGYTAPFVNFGYQEVEPAVATGLVFRDANGNGTQDAGEPGLAGVTLNVTHDETGALTRLTTGVDGSYRFEASGNINHQIAVDTATLPFNAQLTTGRDSYNLNVPPGYTAPFVNFGYQEVEPAVATGTVFADDNRNGMQDVTERGIPGVRVDITPTDGDPFFVSTAEDGSYRVELSETRFSVAVRPETLPYPDPILTTLRPSYTLNVPMGFIAPNIDFGYRNADPDDSPKVTAAPIGDDRPEPLRPVARPEDPPEEPDAPVEDAEPITGLWDFYNASFPFECTGIGVIMVPGSENCQARLTISADRQTLSAEPGTCEDDSGSIFGPPSMPNQAPPRGLTEPTMTLGDDGNYHMTIDLTPMGAPGEMNFALDFVSDTEVVGYVDGKMVVEGVFCTLRREITGTRIGD